MFWLVDCFHDSRLWVIWFMTFAHDSYYESWVSCTRLIWVRDLVCWLWSDFWDKADWLVWVIWGFHTMTHYESYVYVTREWWVTLGLGSWRCVYKGRGPRPLVRSSRNHLSTFLYLSCNTISLVFIVLYLTRSELSISHTYLPGD